VMTEEFEQAIHGARARSYGQKGRAL
jgi:hypothetical protein